MNEMGSSLVTSSAERADFDPQWYREKYPDVAASGMDPADHYHWIGKTLDRYPSADAAAKGQTRLSSQIRGGTPNQASFRSFGTIEHNPLISVLIVGFNSRKDLEVLFPTLACQTYRNFEVIFVENSEEDTEPLLRRYFSRAEFVRADNVGFAEGNNVALRLARGELIGLVNPDTRLLPDTFQQLLDSLRYDELAACSVPKINFFERFVPVRLSANRPFSVTRAELLEGLSYRKLFVRQGTDNGDRLCSDEDGVLAFDLPFESERNSMVTLLGREDLLSCKIAIGFAPLQTKLQASARTFSLLLIFDAASSSGARYLVNNAGSALHADGSPYDRGFAEFDEGRYFSKAYVNALCGCAALIRRIAILDREIFPGSFFAYYEDSELSHWLAQQGYRILYQPAALVYHRHSESTDEKSLTWNVLVHRSRSLYDLATGVTTSPLRVFSVDYPKDLNGDLRQRLEAFDEKVRQASTFAELLRPSRRTACIYNTYFPSMGGGEKHALEVASLLRRDYQVYLASEDDFDIGHLQAYFSVELEGIRKIICKNIDSHFTTKFNLFINSTYQSNLLSFSRNSFYIVSFPHTHITSEVKECYKFFHNSEFTAGWANTYWGNHISETMLPILGKYPSLALEEEDGKCKVIVSVGRFTYEGHCKNHHIIVNAFKAIVREHSQISGWVLKIVGSCDLTRKDATRYLGDLQQAAAGHSIQILPNVDRSALDAIYAESALYVHATGLGRPADLPQLHEHFGISTFEAMAHGCLPVVYGVGGPAQQLNNLEYAFTYRNEAELRGVLLDAMAEFSAGRIDPAKIKKHARQMHEANFERTQALLDCNM